MPRFSLEDIESARPEDLAKLASTTEEEIQRQIAEDGGFDMGEVDPSRLTARRGNQLRRRLKGAVKWLFAPNPLEPPT